MSLKDDLASDVKKIFADSWSTRDGQVVPEQANVQLGNDAVKITGTVLYADLAESTKLVNNFKAEFAAEIYKAYLHCASKIIRSENGSITAFDGDRIMAVYIGDSKCSSAARTALKINYVVRNIINPAIKSQYPNRDYTVQQAIGIDTSEVFVARTGIRGSNDLVWVGRAANYAAKLCSLRDGNYSTWITSDVYKMLNDGAKFAGQDKKDMWEARTWTAYGITVHRSSYWWPI
jgi:class 3 adenylate cyclase